MGHLFGIIKIRNVAFSLRKHNEPHAPNFSQARFAPSSIYMFLNLGWTWIELTCRVGLSSIGIALMGVRVLLLIRRISRVCHISNGFNQNLLQSKIESFTVKLYNRCIVYYTHTSRVLFDFHEWNLHYALVYVLNGNNIFHCVKVKAVLSQRAHFFAFLFILSSNFLKQKSLVLVKYI